MRWLWCAGSCFDSRSLAWSDMGCIRLGLTTCRAGGHTRQIGQVEGQVVTGGYQRRRVRVGHGTKGVGEKVKRKGRCKMYKIVWCG